MYFASLTVALLAACATANPFAATSKNNAKSAYMSKLMRGARETENSQLRRLNDAEEYEIDISGYSVKFDKCQFVKTYDDELAEDEESSTVLATKRFAIFRLCPTGSCSSCNYNFGEYLVDLDDYLQATVEYQQELQQDMCDACNECGQDEEEEAQDEAQEDGQDNGEEDGGRRRRKLAVDCDSCADECDKIENMEDNGYFDATNFLECQMIYDPEDDGKDALYAGPMCASSGTKIKIGVFTDENCNYVDANKKVDDYLVNGDGYQMKLSHALLKTVYSSDTCVSCLVEEEEDENNNGNDDGEEKEPEVAEMCQQLYEASAKCEKKHGFDDGYANYDGYENQLAQEEVVCDYIKSLEAGTYDNEGEIAIFGSNSTVGGGKKTTVGQKLALAFFVIGTVLLAVYAAMLHSKLTKGSASGLSSTGGAMA